MPPGDPDSDIGDLAESCVRFVKEALGIELDYTPDTLPVLDHYVRVRPGEPTDAVVALLAPATGAYFGEVVHRSLGARWHTAGDDFRVYRLEFDRFYLCFNPIGVAVEAITRADAEAWNAHFSVLDETRAEVDRSLARNAAVDEDDYYRFSVRFEVLQLVTDLLGALETRGGRGRRSFGPDVYRAACGEGGERGRS